MTRAKAEDREWVRKVENYAKQKPNLECTLDLDSFIVYIITWIMTLKIPYNNYTFILLKYIKSIPEYFPQLQTVVLPWIAEY